jgi:hypothetical protein
MRRALYERTAQRALSIVTEFFEPANVLSVARSTRPPT